MGMEEHSRNNTKKNWLLPSNQSESLILETFCILNNAALDESGVALCHSVIVLSCTAIFLATTALMGGGQNSVCAFNDDDKDCRKAMNTYGGNRVVVVTLLDYWWRAVDVSMEISQLCLAGKVADMSATRRRRAQMSPILVKKCMSGQHELVPDTGNLRQ